MRAIDLWNAGDAVREKARHALRDVEQGRATKYGMRDLQADDPILLVRTESVAFMLTGMAIECLIKSALVPTVAPAERKRAYVHDLLGLWNLLQEGCPRVKAISLSNQDQMLLEDLTAFVEWAGRYPVPRKLPGRADASAGDADGTAHWKPKDCSSEALDGARELFCRLYRVLWPIPAPGTRQGDHSESCESRREGG